MVRRGRTTSGASVLGAENDTCCREVDEFPHLDRLTPECISKTRMASTIAEDCNDNPITEKLLCLPTPARNARLRKRPQSSSSSTRSERSPSFAASKNLVVPNSIASETSRGPEPWALPSLDEGESVVDKSRSLTSYRDLLRARGSEALQRTAEKIQKGTSEQQLTKPQISDARTTCEVAPSAAMSLHEVKHAPSALTHSIPSSACADSPTYARPSARPDCPRQAQVQHFSMMQHCQACPQSDNCQMQQTNINSPSQQLVYDDIQCSLRSNCQPACFVGNVMPFISNYSQQALPSSMAVSIPWRSPAGNPHSLMVSNNTAAEDEKDLMAIAMPDAFSMSRDEIAEQLRSAAPCTYED